jgi:hypothetical protein
MHALSLVFVGPGTLVRYDPERASLHAIAHYALGRKKDADAALSELIAKYHASTAYQIAEVYAFRNRSGEAFKWLDRAYVQRDDDLIGTKVERPAICRVLEEAQPANLNMLPYEQFLRNGSPQVPGWGLKRLLLILSDRIFDSRVDRGIPNLTAAPVGPDTRPRVSFRAASIMFFSSTKSLRGSSTCGFGSAVGRGR